MNVTAGGDAAISARSLVKHYGPVKAVKEVNLDVRRGEIYGFLGRNGAGKTTTIRMLLGLIRPTSGSILLFGLPLHGNREKILGRVGSLVESASAYPNLTVRENLEIQRRLTRSPAGSVERIVDLLKLGEYANRRTGTLSLGNKQRLSLARALLHRPELLILDEPANGLDPAGIIEIRALLRRLAAEEGITVFMSSHILDEVEHLADRIGIIHDGILVEEVSAEELRRRNRVSIDIDVADSVRAEEILRRELGISGIARIDSRALSITDPEIEPEAVARTLVNAGIGISRLLPVEEDLERHFMRITEGNT